MEFLIPAKLISESIIFCQRIPFYPSGSNNEKVVRVALFKWLSS